MPYNPNHKGFSMSFGERLAAYRAGDRSVIIPLDERMTDEDVRRLRAEREATQIVKRFTSVAAPRPRVTIPKAVCECGNPDCHMDEEET